MSASDASVAVFGSFCVLALFTIVATFWKKSDPETDDEESRVKVGADRIRATLSQFKMTDLQKKKKWLSLLYEFIQVRTTGSSSRNVPSFLWSSFLKPSSPLSHVCSVLTIFY